MLHSELGHIEQHYLPHFLASFVEMLFGLYLTEITLAHSLLSYLAMSQLCLAFVDVILQFLAVICYFSISFQQCSVLFGHFQK